jgi:hypothetical protein
MGNNQCRLASVPDSSPAKNFVSSALRHAYLRTEITVDLGEEAISAEAATSQTDGPVFVVSAANPRSCPTDADENTERHQRLIDAVDEAGISWAPALGSDPFSDWAEPSLALFDTTRKKARQFGRQFGQFAVFEIDPTTTTVHGCLSRWAISRSHEQRCLPENDDTLADAAARSLGIEIVNGLKRFRYRGWQPVGSTELGCSHCDTPALELFAVVHQQRRGDIVEHLAVACSSCTVATPTTKLPTDQRTALERWREYMLAASDAAEFDLTILKYRCYVIRLDRPDDRWVYVGETGQTAEERLAQHMAGIKANNTVERHGVDLRQDLMADLPEFPDRLSAQTFERYLAAKLHLAGFSVAGGR